MDYRRKNDHVEAALRAEPHKHPGIAGLLVAETEIFSDKNGAHLKIPNKNLVYKFLGRELCEVLGEGQDHRGVDADLSETTQALFRGGKAQGGGVRAENLLGKRVERESRGDGADVAGASDGSAQDGLMAQVDAVKIADGERTATVRSGMAGGPSLGRAKQLERRWPGSGWARAFAGRAGFVHFHIDFQAVVGELHVGIAEIAQAFIGFRVRQVMRDRGKAGALRI